MNDLKKEILTLGLGIIASLSLFGTSCTKERPYESLFKERVMDKKVVDTTSEFLYLPSVGDSPRTSSATRPHWIGGEKIVQFKFTENSLDVLEVETDPRFQGNVTNLKPVLSIPIKHIAYRCKKNSNDECSNEEEENNDISWIHKDKFQLDIDQLAIQETNFLPIEITNLFEGCYQEIDSNVSSFELNENVLNVKIEKTFKSAIQCAGNLNSLSDLTFNVSYFYSLVKLNQLSSPDYEKAYYPTTDKNTFGFFETTDETLTVDHREEEGQEVSMISRWNPKKKVIPYQLSEHFEKPENASIKEAALKSIGIINESFKAAGVDMKIEVHAQTALQQTGDLRNNTVVLVEDPTAYGIIGYGPSAKNPRTGEILHARTVMYLGNIKKFIRSTYEEIVIARKKEAEKIKPLSEQTLVLAENLIPTKATRIEKESSKKSLSVKNGLGSGHPHAHLHIEDAIKELKNVKKNSDQSSQFAGQLKNELEALSKLNVYPAALFNFDFAVETALIDPFNELPLKPWEELTEAEKVHAMNVLVPYVFIPVMVHEMGHNLGLRHNFNGSEDKSHFYSQEELDQFGLRGPMLYSSIMDYAFKNTNELRVMGKYDIAALKFGYARQLELTNGQTIPVQNTLEEMLQQQQVQASALVDYMYCTDEHVGLNPGCKRFDEGTNYTEIALHYIKSYHESYTKRNFRNKRKNFSLMDDPLYASNIQAHFFNLRMFFEAYERIQERFQIPEEIWKSKEPQYAFLNDLYTAMTLSAEFFMDVIKTPDIHCAIALKTQPQQIVGLEKLAGLESIMGNESVNCFSPQVNELIDRVNEQNKAQGRPELLITAETGKSFHSKKDPNSTNSYVDQIDQRGIWADKLLAVQYLFGRKLGVYSLDKFQSNYLHIAEIKTALKETLDQLLKDEIISLSSLRNQKGEVLTTADGQELIVQMGHSMMDTHSLQEPLNEKVNAFIKNPLLGSDSEQSESSSQEKWFSKEAFRLANETSTSIAFSTVNYDFLVEYSVYKSIPQSGFKPEDFTSLQLSGERYLALPENKSALELFQKITLAQQAPEKDPVLLAQLKQKLDSLILVSP